MKANDYNECVDKYADRLFRFACSMLSERMDAEDVVQKVFEKFWIKHKDVQVEKAKSYLFTSIYHGCIDLIRKRKRESGESVVLRMGAHDRHQIGFEIRDAVQSALTHLTDIQRTVVLLRDYEGYSYEEIGNMCELTESQVKVYIFRARKKLQTQLHHLKYA